jgi:multidrug efflux pump subunit AcrB
MSHKEEHKEHKMNLNIAGKLAKGFIEHPLTFILFTTILVLGLLTIKMMPREENPQIKVAGGAIIVPLPGAKADEIQKVVIEPLEEKIRQIKGVENIYSLAKDSMGIVQVQFYIGQEQYISDLKLYDRIIKNMDLLPKQAMTPIIKTMDIDVDIPVASIAFYSTDPNKMPMTELYKVVDRLGHDINDIDNVAQVDLKGERKEQINILLDLKKLQKYEITFGQVAHALTNITFELPKMKADTKDGDYAILRVASAVKDVDDVANIIIDSYNGKPVYLKDLGEVKKGEDIQNKKIAYLKSKENGLKSKEIPQITMTISKLKGANTVTINETLFKYLESRKEELAKKNIGYVITRDDGYTANHAVNELIFHLEISVVIIAILLIFALGFKEALIVSLTVPMILALTLFTGFMLGETINRITLFALLLSLGLLVDAAIIVIENIHRHMHSPENNHRSLKYIAINATNEIGNPTNIATIAIILTFLPMFLVGGMMGQFMHPLPVFVPIALIYSLVIAYMFTPYFVTKLLKKKEHKDAN